MQITREHLTADIQALTLQRDQLISQVNMVIGALKYAEAALATLDQPKSAKLVPTSEPANLVPEHGADTLSPVVD